MELMNEFMSPTRADHPTAYYFGVRSLCQLVIVVGFNLADEVLADPLKRC